jgi:hypothetical protein
MFDKIYVLAALFAISFYICHDATLQESNTLQFISRVLLLLLQRAVARLLS